MNLRKLTALLAISFCSLSALATGGSEDGTKCNEKRKFIEDRKANSISVEELIREIFREQRPILLLGEEHGNSRLQAYSEMLPLIRKSAPSLNCIVLENYNLDTLPIFEAFNKGDDTLMNGPAMDNSLISREIFKYIRAMGYEIYPIDDTASQNPYNVGFGAWVDYRNRFMSSQIKGLLDSKKCTGVVQSIGAAHLTNWNPNGYPTLDSRLNDLNLKSHKLLYLTPAVISGIGVQTEVSQTWIWTARIANIDSKGIDLNSSDLICSDVPALPKSTMAFKNITAVDSALGVDTFSADKPRIFGRFSDFEGTIVFAPVAGGDLERWNSALYGRLSDLGVMTY